MILADFRSSARRLAAFAAVLGFVAPAAARSPALLEASTVTPARLHVTVSSTGASQVSAPYVAVVAEDAPWRRPLHEAVLKGRPEVSWELPPGRYRLAAGAPGFWLELQPVIELVPGEDRTTAVHLAALVPIEGRVLDPDGRPIPGATVAHTRRLIHGFPGRLSPLGERHLADSFEATTDEDGRFVSHLHPEAGSFLAVQATGSAPRFFPNLRLPGAAATLREITLRPGASLSVRWSFETGVAGSHDRLQLVPADRVYPGGLDLAGVLAFWARPLEDGSQTWPSLPPGRYEIWLKAPPSGPHTVGPVRLGEVLLEPGAARVETVDVPEVRIREPLPAGRRELAPSLRLLLPVIPGPEIETLRITGSPGPARGSELAYSAEPVSGGHLLTIEEGCRAGARYLVVTEARVGGVGPLDSTACAETLRSDLHARADLALALQAPPGVALEDLGPAARIDARSCAGPTPPSAQLEIPVPAIEKGRFRSPVPAGCFDLAVRVGDFAPLTWSRLVLPAGDLVDLGTRRLRSGAALLVRVVSPDDHRPLEGVRVGVATREELQSLFASASQGRPFELPSGSAETPAVTDPHGWARLYGLPTSVDLVPLLLAPGRRVPAPADAVVLSPGEELVLDALELPPPAVLAVELELSADLKDRGVEAYEVYAASGDRTPLRLSFTRKVDPSGRAYFEELLPGRYRLMGIARQPGGRPFPAGAMEVEIAPASDATVTLSLADALYGGRVTYQDEPVEGSLSLSPVSPADRRGMTVRLDSDGRYEVPLEGPGVYRVQVSDLRDRRFRNASLPEVEFEDPALPVDIRLPGAVIAGQVIDESGRPVAGARIDATGRRSTAAAERVQHVGRSERSDEAGRFTIESVESGPWTLVAKAGEGQSRPETLEVLEDARVDGVRLVIDGSAPIEGQVVDGFGQQVPGARVWVSLQPETAGEALPPIAATTDQAGRFTVPGAHEGRLANVEISTPAGSSAALRAVLAEGLRLDLPPLGGPLEVVAPCSAEAAWLVRDLFLVTESGAFLTLQRHASSTRTGEDSSCRILWTVPTLAAGAWKLVRVGGSNDAAALGAGAGQLLPELAVVRSLPGSVQRVPFQGAPKSRHDVGAEGCDRPISERRGP